MRYVLHRRLTHLTVRRRGRINTAHTKIAAMPAGQPIEIGATIAPAKKPRSIEFNIALLAYHFLIAHSLEKFDRSSA